MRRGAWLLLVLCACPAVPAPVPAPSRFNGVWAQRSDDGGVSEGLVVHDSRDGGVVWSPLGLKFLDGGLILTHRCRDFSVDNATGRVTAVAGVLPAGVVTEAPGGFEFVWTLDTNAIVSARLTLKPSPTALREARLRGTVLDGSVDLQLEWLSLDASVADREHRQFTGSRQHSCE